MTGQHYPDGIAKQAIQKANEDTSLRPRDRQFLVMGMELMQEGLSHEAQAILAEWIEQRDNGSNNIVMADAADAVEYLNSAFTRLGLDSVSEDAE